MTNSIEKMNNGRGKDKNTRAMHPNSLKNLKPNPDWVPGFSPNPQGQSITARQKEMMSEVSPFDGQGRTWLESLAEGGMMDILLTDEEIRKLADNFFTYDDSDGFSGYIDGLSDGAKAQLKKVVEWGNKDCPHIGYVNGSSWIYRRRECSECCQALLKEVE